MAKHRNNVTPLPKVPEERHTWKCKQCGMSGKVATKEEVEIAKRVHNILAGH